MGTAVAEERRGLIYGKIFNKGACALFVSIDASRRVVVYTLSTPDRDREKPPSFC